MFVEYIRHISPFKLNLRLNPVYVILGASITRADPLIKKET